MYYRIIEIKLCIVDAFSLRFYCALLGFCVCSSVTCLGNEIWGENDNVEGVWRLKSNWTEKKFDLKVFSLNIIFY